MERQNGIRLRQGLLRDIQEFIVIMIDRSEEI